MNPRLLALAALMLLLVPLAVAQPPGATVDKVTVRIQQATSTTQIQHRIEVTVVDPAAVNSSGGFELHLDLRASNVTATAERAGQSRPLTLSAPSEGGPYRIYRTNLSGLYSDLRAQDKLSVLVAYTAGATVSERLPYGAKQLVVYATGADGDLPVSDALGPFNPTNNGDEQHAVRSDVAAGFGYSVGFVGARETGGAGSRDLNPYLLFFAGLAAGFLVAWILFKRKPKAKRFEKGGQMESGAMLEARRRTLMAALKELELAHEAKEIPDAAYAPLKEEYKAQTVRVLRSIEDKKEAPGTKP